MAKTTGPLLSLGASGSVGKTLTYSTWKGVSYVRQLVKPTYRNSTEQMAVRDIVSDASIAWKTEATVGAIEIDSAYKLAYTVATQGQALSGFNLFMRDCMSINLINTAGVKSYDGSLAIATAPGVLA
jgi:hypothetical protein